MLESGLMGSAGLVDSVGITGHCLEQYSEDMIGLGAACPERRDRKEEVEADGRVWEIQIGYQRMLPEWVPNYNLCKPRHVCEELRL